MKNIVIMGAGDLGKEIVWLIEDINRRSPLYSIIGFLDDDVSKTGREFYGYKVLGTIDTVYELRRKMPLGAVIAIQDGSVRKAIVDSHKEFTEWETIIHPTSVIASTAYLGKGSVVFPNVTISVDSKLGDFGLYYIHAVIGNDCVFGSYVSVMSGVSISEHVAVGDGSYLAAGSCVYPHRILGRNVEVSVGATVTENCKDDTKVVEKNSRFFLFK